MSNTDSNGDLIGPQAASSWSSISLSSPSFPLFDWAFAFGCRLNVVPSGMYDLLHWLSARYGNPVIMITENGGISSPPFLHSSPSFPPPLLPLTSAPYLSAAVVDVPGETELPLSEALHDSFRVDYYSSYLASVTRAMDEGVQVKGYFAWSLMVLPSPYPCCRGECVTSCSPLFVSLRITLNGLMVTIIALVCIMW
jgi:hypothetical protein